MFCAFTIKAQNIINGSFENNTAISYIWNLTNAQYNATIASSSAIGLSNIELTINLKHLPNALYICQIVSEKGINLYTERLTLFR